ncbi:MAG TPA: FAD-dependent oxidoreductase [Atribacterota bacterium]|nr:FAD-dependent oxidoreductase [Atribacterota bacterium]
MKVIVVGGVAGGASAAARLRRLDENAEIIILERGQYISYANCGLPYYIGEVIKKKDNLVVQSPEDMKKRFNIDVRILNEVKNIDTEKKQVEIYDIKNKKNYRENYDKLILSPGAIPIKPPIKGFDSPNVFTLRDIPDTLAIKNFVDDHNPKSAVVVGAGFIGMELVENLHRRGMAITIVELAEQVLAPLDSEMAALIQQHLKEKKVEFYLNDEVKEVEHREIFSLVKLGSGREIKTDMVLIGIGVRPEVTLAKGAGLEIGERGGIKVDRFLKTSNPDIYAVGDAIEVVDYINGNPTLIPLAGPANKQGRIAANNICGIAEGYEGTQGTSILKVFDMTVAATGNNEKLLKRLKIPYGKSFTHSSSHAGYYPEALPLSVKLIFSPGNGNILGAQIVGYDGVDKRIDVIATAIRAGMTVYDLEKLELAYAPPYSSAKDPVNMAGYVASNILKGDSAIIHWHDINKLDREKTVLIDVRTPEEFSLGTIKGAKNIPVDELRNRLSEIPQDREIIIFCQVGLRGYLACRILRQKGFKNIKNLSGGYKTYFPAVQKQDNPDIYQYEKIEKSDLIKASELSSVSEETDIKAKIKLDACGLQCPGPIIKVFKGINEMKEGEVLEISATDPAFGIDLESWCKRTGNQLLRIIREGTTTRAWIKKGSKQIMDNLENKEIKSSGNDKTLVVFSDNLDKAIASFIIANGAAAMGRKVTMFFTFWGLNILRKPTGENVKKDFLGRMFGMMMPKGSQKLKLSQMSMGGLGGKMIRYIMKKNNALSLEESIEQAMEQGIKIIACNMSMDLMGIKKEELVDGIEIGGVATYLAAAETADTNLFI